MYTPSTPKLNNEQFCSIVPLSFSLCVYPFESKLQHYHPQVYQYTFPNNQDLLLTQ